MESIRTGDVILFSGNTPTSFLLRTFVSSEWNHAGIAVRFHNKHISLTEQGTLYILETNSSTRWDEIVQQDIVGAGFTRADIVFNKYNKIAVRRLHEVFRTQELITLTEQFMEQYRGNRFPSTFLPFIGVWLGIPLADGTYGTDEMIESGLLYEHPNESIRALECPASRKEMFCSELIAHYYRYCVGAQYSRLTGLPYDGKLSTLFGSGMSELAEMYAPGHYSHVITPNASIFHRELEIIHVAHADMWYVILQPLLLILVILLGIWMVLPKK
jgi:hypothetical protein